MNLDLTEKWFINKNLSDSTQSLYRLGLSKYCKLVGKNLNELVDEAEEEEDNIPRLRNRKIDSYIPMFKKSLEDAHLAPQTIKVYVSAVKSFYKYYKITIPDVTTDVNDICLEKNEGRLLTKEDIRDMIEVSPIREKTIIYLMAMTGMAQAEMRSLTIKKFLDAASEALDKKIKTVEELFEYEKDLETVVLSLMITRQKVNYRYNTFIPPEVTRNILYYLKDRSYGRNEKIRIIDVNKELFVNHNGEKLNKHTVSSNFNRIGKKLGFENSEYGAYGFWRSHGLRKYFISTIINETGDHILADYLVGHKISAIKRAYWKADPSKLKKNYIDVMEYLSIDGGKVTDYTSEEYTKIKKEMKEMKEKDLKRQAELNEKDLKIQSLEATVNELTGRMDNVESNIELKSDEDVEVLKKLLNKVEKRYKENPDGLNHITDAEWDELKQQIEK
jgi:integrase/DNA-binding protein YbaB